MSIASEITRLQNDSAAIASAIAAKGVTVPSGSGFDDYAGLIANISGGGISDDWIKDGDTHLWIEIIDDYQLAQTIRVRLIGTIDWGDGTTKDTANVTTYTNFTHTYTEKGKYRIDLHKTSGTFYLGGNSSSYCIMGGAGDSGSHRRDVFYQVEIGQGLSTLSGYAFYQCHSLRRAYIPKNITTLGTSTFYQNYSLREVIFEDPSTITSATLTSNFQTCYVLQYLTPLNITGATAISAITRNNHSLKEFTIPSSVTSIAANSFANNYCLSHLWCLPTSAPTVANANAFTSLPSGCVIHVPYGSLSSYQGAGIWSTYSSQMAEAGTVKYTLSSVTRDNLSPMVAASGSFTTTLTPDSGKTISSVTVKMGGTDITSTAYSAGVVTIASVTGNIEITATAT